MRSPARARTERLWSTAVVNPLPVLAGHTGALRLARFSPDGTRIITAGGTVHFEAAALPSQLEDKRGGRRDLYARFDLESLEPILPASVRLDSNRVRYVAEQRRAGELLAW